MAVSPTLVKFLHIGKCGGTHFSHIAGDFNSFQSEYAIQKLSHEQRLESVIAGELYLFSIRSPFTRFVSAFDSRKRQGLPRKFNRWSKSEEWLYENFEFANDLAEALSDEARRSDAIQGIKANLHLRTKQIDWFISEPDFFETKPPLSILRIENYEADVKRLFAKLSPEFTPRFRDDEIERHTNKYHNINPTLSDLARQNIKAFYQQDFAFYEACEIWINS